MEKFNNQFEVKSFSCTIPSKILECLQEKGLDEENSQIVGDWFSAQEKLVVTKADEILLNLSYFDVYMAVNNREEALNSLFDALTQAEHEGIKELVVVINNKIDRLGAE